MLTLRTHIGLTQTGLANYLHVSRRAVGEWEAGSSYPKVDHIKKLITLAIQQRAFPAGREVEAVRELWQISRQKVLLDELWLAGLLTGKAGANGDVNLPAPIQVKAEKPHRNSERKTVINIPFEPTSFIGRGAELSEIARLLDDPNCRLLTLLGSGGIGKTRLAIEVAQSQTSIFRDGVVFVPLASVGAPAQIVTAIGSAFNLSFAGHSDPTAHLLEHLHEQQVLLVLDNFEHVLEGSDLVHNILQHAPYVTVLLTSRVRLNLQAEWLFDVEGLSYPLNDAQSLTDLTHYTAVKLFLQRATQVQLTFQATESTLMSIVRICQQLAGMPLAIELAASGVRTLAVAEIEEQIRSNLDALTTSLRDVPARHRSLRAVFDHSWNLLSESERTLLSRLAVFRGSCRADAAEQITEIDVYQLMRLVDKSLLRQINTPNTAYEPRFFLLEPIREYALEKLQVSGELQIRQHIHASYYLNLAETAIEQWQLQGADAALEQIDHELDNIRAALQWASESDVPFGLQLAGALARYWRCRAYLTEGRMWLEGFLALDEDNTDSAAIQARLRAVNGAGWLAVDLYDFEQATLRFEQGKMLRSILGETEDDTSILANAGLQARANGQYTRATMLLEDMLARLRALGDRGTLSTGGLGFALYALALVLREQSEFVKATNLLEECVEFHRAINDREAMAQGMLGLSDIARDQGDATGIRKYAEQCLETFREIGTQWAIGFSLNNLGMAAYLEGDLLQAYDLVSESLALFRSHKTDGSIAEVLVTIGHILVAQGDLVGADEAFTESLRLALTVGPRLLVVADLEGLASVMTKQGKMQFAVRFLATASNLRDQMNAPVRPADQPVVEQSMAVAKQSLGRDIFAALWSQTEKLPLEQILRESPFGELLSQSDESSVTEEPPRSAKSQPVMESSKPINAPTAAVSTSNGRRVDWGDALSVPNFYGRGWEINLLKEWVVEERCQVISVLGMGGIGKSALTVSLMHQVAEHFEVVIWRSLRDLPTYEALLEDLLQVLVPETFRDITVSFERKMGVLLDQMRAARTLIVLDNLETVLEEGEGQGQMRPGYEGFAQFLRLSAETKHRSCVVLTSREKPGELVVLEGIRSTVRVLRLARLDVEACEQLLAEKEVVGEPTERARLIDAYTGNPLALKIVAQTIVDLFDGAIAPFLKQGEIIFGGVRELLSEQFVRLSDLEQNVLLWLAIMREPLTFDELGHVLVTPIPRGRVLEAVESLRRRSLIERGVQPGSFTLQSVVLEYVTSRLVTEVSDEIKEGRFGLLIEYGLELAQTREYVRQTQQRMIVAPILEYLRSEYRLKSALEDRLVLLLTQLSTRAETAQGYGPANLLAMLHLLRGHLRKLDLSRLVVRSAYLQGVEIQDTTLSKAFIQDSVFSDTFDSVIALDVSKSGKEWAASTRRGEVLIWNASSMTLQSAWQAHSDMIWTIKFSADGRILATGSWDCTLKVWDVESGKLLWLSRHIAHVNCLAFSPDNRRLASGSNDATVVLWDVESGIQIQTLPHPVAVSGCTVNWSPDGRLLVSGDLEGYIRLWEISGSGPAKCLQVFAGHATFVDALAFSPDGRILASTSFDGTVKLWDLINDQFYPRKTIVGHLARIGRLAWSPDGLTLACGGIDKMIWLVDVEKGSYRTVLQGHAHHVSGLAFMPDGSSLLSGGGNALHQWDVINMHCMHTVEGYSKSLYAVDWSPDSMHLIGGGIDKIVTLWNLSDDTLPYSLDGHAGAVCGVGWSPDGKSLASSEWNNVIRLWDPVSGICLKILQYPNDPDNLFYALAWSPDGERLAVGTSKHGVQIFESKTYHQPWMGYEFPTWIRRVVWSPDGMLLAGAGDDGIVYVWDATDGTLRYQLAGHHSMVVSLAWSPDGTQLASGSRGVDGGELFIWDVQNDYRLRVIENHPGVVYAIAWGTNEDILISGDGDGTLRWWSVQNGECLLVRHVHVNRIQALSRSPDGTKLASCGNDGAIMIWDLQSGEHLQTLRRDRPYERLNITGIRGLTEAQKTTLRMLGAIEDGNA